MRLYIGIDWSKSKHDLCYLNQAGAFSFHLLEVCQYYGCDQMLKKRTSKIGEVENKS